MATRRIIVAGSDPAGRDRLCKLIKHPDANIVQVKSREALSIGQADCAVLALVVMTDLTSAHSVDVAVEFESRAFPKIFVADPYIARTDLVLRRAGATEVLDASVEDDLLRLKINAVISRCAPITIGPTNDAVLSWGKIKLYPKTLEGEYDGTSVYLSKSDFGILSLLIRAEGKIITRDDYISLMGPGSTELALNSKIKLLRNKFREIDPGFRAIRTVYGLGYRLEA